MPYNEDKRIDLAVPFLQEGTALFLGNAPDARQGCPRWKGFRLLYLSDLVASLTPDLRQYLFPGADAALSADELCQRIRELAGIGEQTGLLYREEGFLFFHPEEYEKRASAPRDERSRKCRKRGRSGPGFFDICFSVLGEEAAGVGAGVAEVAEATKVAPAEPAEVAEAVEEKPDPRVQAILEAWDAIERKFGITIEDMQVLLGYKVKLSRLRITTSSKIYLTDFDNQEVKMNDLSKALYFFFLRYPEGARLKELHEHEDEILRIYSGITGRDDPEKIRKSARNLLDPYGNELNVSLSRIKRAFKNVVNDRVARFYYVSGGSGEVRKVVLDRDLVIWEH